jgi:Fe-S cluster assembly protein SufB
MSEQKFAQQNQQPNMRNPQITDAHDFAMPEVASATIPRGLTWQTVEEIAAIKNEPDWMRAARLAAYKIFTQKKLPAWGPDLSGIKFDDILYYLRATKQQEKSWDDLPQEIKDTYDRIGVPEHEKKWLAGVSAQYESEVVYESVQKELTKQGVIFCDMDTAVRKYPDIVQKYFGTLIPAADNTFAALNSAVWSGGSFVYVPKGVKVTMPLQAYFRINTERFGQFERTLIIADEGSDVHYMEGCTAPTYATASLHAAVVEVFALDGAHVRYTTVQNWSSNVYNLVTKRARADKNASVEWVDCNIGSGVTMKYPAVHLSGEHARGDVLSIAIAGKDQHQDTGAKMIHLAPHTTSRVISKSISKDGGQSSYRGLVHVAPSAHESTSFVQCDALLADDHSRSDTYPTIKVLNTHSSVAHEASVERLHNEQIFFLQSRGLSESVARGLMVNGFIAPVAKEIPMEYAIELYRLINMEMEDSVG